MARLRSMIEWTLHRGDMVLTYLRIACGCANGAMPQEHLNDTNVGSTFKQMGCKAVPERMRTQALGNPSMYCRKTENSAYSFFADWFIRMFAWK